MIRFPHTLLDGYRNFMDGRYTQERDRYRTLAVTGQTPKYLLIACCDSRAAPETIFDCGPGELFVVRNVANLVPPYEPDGSYHSTSAALEFAVQSLKVQDIIVMGHGRCGGIMAALDPDAAPLSPGDFIGKWMGLVGQAAEELINTDVLTASERQRAMELGLLQLNPLMQHSLTVNSEQSLPVNRFAPAPVASSAKLKVLINAQQQFQQSSLFTQSPLALNRLDNHSRELEALLTQVVVDVIGPEQASSRLIEILRKP